jgi:AraC-like DNA-binding protein
MIMAEEETMTRTSPARHETITASADDADALSDVLHAIHLRGRDVRRTETSGAFLGEEPAGVRAVYLVEQGSLQLRLPGQVVSIEAGGLALVASGAAHTLRADPDSVWITGIFEVEEHSAEAVLRVLPPAVIIAPGARTHPWLDVARELILAELTDPNPGGRVMVSRLLDLLFIRALRDWAAHAAERTGGLLTATLDRPVARALAAVHRTPGRAWSVPELAHIAGLSRSAFAERFAELVGVPPGRYAAQQRLAHADQLLRRTDHPIARIAGEVGYESEAAFSRAFSQQYGQSPRARRRSAPLAGSDALAAGTLATGDALAASQAQ